MKRIAILGIGGVGGYLGGMLSLAYAKSKKYEIIFLARGEQKVAIRQRGLELIVGDTSCNVRPKLVTSDPEKVGKIDVLIVCTKSYSLPASLVVYKDNLNPGAIVLTLQNAVNQEKLVDELPDRVFHLKGCIYILSKIIGYGTIENKPGPKKLYMGTSGNQSVQPFKELAAIFQEADIDAVLTNNIDLLIWEKFMFISPLATATSYFMSFIGSVLADKDKAEFLRKLLDESYELSKALKVELPNDMPEIILKRIGKLPYDSRTSMQIDFERGGRTEINALVEYVVSSARELDVHVPTYETAFSSLKSRNNREMNLGVF